MPWFVHLIGVVWGLGLLLIVVENIVKFRRTKRPTWSQFAYVVLLGSLLVAWIVSHTIQTVNAAPLQFSDIEAEVAVKPWTALRDADVIKQQLDTSCGAASLATILSSFYGENVSERDVLAKLYIDDAATSFADLANATLAFDYKAVGLALSFGQLRKLKVPAIAYVIADRGEDHFTVIRGISDDGRVHLGDPSWGNRTFSKHRFLRLWETRDDKTHKGKILLIVPRGQQLDAVTSEFFAEPEERTGVAVELLPLWHMESTFPSSP